MAVAERDWAPEREAVAHAVVGRTRTVLLYPNRPDLSVGEFREQVDEKQTEHVVSQRRRFRDKQKLQSRFAIADVHFRPGCAG